MHLHVLAQMKQGDYELNRRTFFRFSFSALAGGTLPLVALVAEDDHDKHDQHGRGHGRRDDDQGEDKHNRGNGNRGRYFRDDDTAYLRQYYGGPVDLPPGLRKKYYRTGKLPPGWEKRFRPFPPDVIRRLPPPPAYCDRGYIDGYAVVYDRRTRVIVDVLDIINVAAGR
jgi:hypothetical protein